MKNICVFCGSGTGSDPVYCEEAEILGIALVQKGLGLVYGGGVVGLMGVIADTVLRLGGTVTGVIPRALAEKEVAHKGLTCLRTVDSMHERKQVMTDLSDAFIAMPGGLGTIEEIFEAITWAQLGFQKKPCAFFNTNGYFNHLLQFLDHAVAEQFIMPEYRNMIIVSGDPEDILDRFSRYAHPTADKAGWALKNSNR